MLADITEKKLSFFFYSFITLLVWNAGTTWWIWNSTDVGSIGAIVANSLLMTLPWWGFRIFKRKFGDNIGYASLIIFWMSFEYIHLNWQLSWPWLTIGNVFAVHPGWVQWYEYTGTSSGTLWVLLVNILLYLGFKKRNDQYRFFSFKFLIPLLLLISVPFILSFILTPDNKTVKQFDNLSNVIIVQPNIDPYNNKFDAATISDQMNLLISLSEKDLDSNTRLVIWPETALSQSLPQDGLKEVHYCKPVFDFVNRHPDITLVTGIESYKTYGPHKATPTARLDERENIYYDEFNSATAIKKDNPLQFYNKSKLVPGVETLPDFLRWMAPVFEKFGGTTGGYGRDKEASVLKENDDPYVVAPIICYESIYGEYVAGYVRKGANLLTIITNDGWWGNTSGHKQHLAYARLRAVETRKWIARSANTGISAVIDNCGDVIQTQPWNKAAFIKAQIPVEDGETFYVRYGDILSKIALASGGLLIMWNVVVTIKKMLMK